MDKTDRLRDYGLAFLLYEHGLGICGYELIRELFIVFIKLILNSYLSLQQKDYLILGDILFLKDLQIFQDFSIRFINFHRFYGIQVNLGSDFRIMPQCLTDDG